MVGKGYIGFEGLEGGDRVARGGEGMWGENRKPSRRGSVWANETRGALYLDLENIFEQG